MYIHLKDVDTIHCIFKGGWILRYYTKSWLCNWSIYTLGGKLSNHSCCFLCETSSCGEQVICIASVFSYLLWELIKNNIRPRVVWWSFCKLINSLLFALMFTEHLSEIFCIGKEWGKKYASIPIKSCKYRGDQYDSGVTRWNDECKVHSYKSVDLSLCNGIAIYSHLEKLAKSYLRQLHSQPRYFNCTEEIENVTGVYNTDFNGKVYQTNLVATHQLQSLPLLWWLPLLIL